MAPLRRTLLLTVALAASIAAGVVWLAPAALVDARIAEMTGGALRLAAEGTVWQAHGALLGGGTRMPLGWRVEPWPLLRGEVQIRVTPDGESAGPPRADIVIANGRVVVRDVELTFPVSLVAAATRPDYARFVSGAVELATPALEIAPTSVRGDVLIRWRAARLVLGEGSVALDLGDVSAALTAAGDRLAGPLSNEGGDVAVRGEITFRANDTLGISSTLAPRRTLDAAHLRMLSGLGPASADGWRVDWRIPLR